MLGKFDISKCYIQVFLEYLMAPIVYFVFFVCFVDKPYSTILSTVAFG